MKRVTIICGGPAGLGPNFVSNIIAQALLVEGFYVFNSREYESRIRGGHNFNAITFSDQPVSSNDEGCDLLIALDDLSKAKHQSDLHKGAITITSTQNAYAAGQACKILGVPFTTLAKLFKAHGHYDENVKEAKQGYDTEKRTLSVKLLPKANKTKTKNAYLQNGSEAVAIGATKSGLDFYFAYPMTPATGVLFELAAKEKENKYVTVEMESEITVVNAALGSAITGAVTMTGTSGGGFDLMTESLTLSGIANIPLVFYLCQRPGPATGAATNTAQGDLNIALYAGHGEFPRIVAAPSDPADAEQIASELLYLSTTYKVPSILLSDKHLADCFYTVTTKPKIRQAKRGVWPARYTSYEADKNKIADNSPQRIIANVGARRALAKKISKAIDGIKPFEIFGKKNSKNVVLGWGSTKGAIQDAIAGLNCTYINVRYLEPLGSKLAPLLKRAKRIIVVENNATGQLASLIAQKTGIMIPEKNKVLRYDGRPFLAQPLAMEIKRRLL